MLIEKISALSKHDVFLIYYMIIIHVMSDVENYLL